MNTFVVEPARQTPIVHECDICVIGGSCTGVFAAVAAARLGASVAIVEMNGFFGGTATAAKVCVWHTHLDTAYERQIIGGLTMEMVATMLKKGTMIDKGPNPYQQYVFLPAEMALELDRMIEAHKIRPFLHTRFVAPVMRDAGEVDAIIIEDKSGRRAIRAKLFIDASGEADLVHRAGLPTYKPERIQPPTSCIIVQGISAIFEHNPGISLRKTVFDPGNPEHLRPGFLWGDFLPAHDMYMIAGTRVHGADCSDADQLTHAEIEARRQIDKIISILKRQSGGDKLVLQELPTHIGVRQTRHVVCEHRLTNHEVMYGERFGDAIMNGSYVVDIHRQDDQGIDYFFLDGTSLVITADGEKIRGRWREETDNLPTFYQMPYRTLVPKGAKNVLVAGRSVDAEEGAFGAIRVMVNTTQMGQAAGTAAWLALQSNITVQDVDTHTLRQLLSDQGAIII